MPLFEPRPLDCDLPDEDPPRFDWVEPPELFEEPADLRELADELFFEAVLPFELLLDELFELLFAALLPPLVLLEVVLFAAGFLLEPERELADFELADFELDDFAAEDFAPPLAVRLPAAPLLAAVDVFEPPDFEADADLAAVPFEPLLAAVPADFEAPVRLELELLDAELFFEPPVLDVAERLLPWLPEDLVAPEDLRAVPPEVEPEDFFAVAMVNPSPSVLFSRHSRKSKLCGP